MIDLHQASTKLQLVDPLIGQLLNAAVHHPTNPLVSPIPVTPDDYFERLLRSITSQQLSVKAAKTIWERVSTELGQPINPITTLGVAEDKLRAAGLSWRKVGYVRSLAQAAADGSLNLSELNALDDEEIIRQLTLVKGIGRWSAEMFLIFALGRSDVFSYGDLGLRTAYRGLYGTEPDPGLIDQWSPYRSSASLALWHSLNNA